MTACSAGSRLRSRDVPSAHLGQEVVMRRFGRVQFILVSLALLLASIPPALPSQAASGTQSQPSCAPGEIVSLRTRDSSTFRTSDCRYKAVFGHYMHYQASPGDW